MGRDLGDEGQVRFGVKVLAQGVELKGIDARVITPRAPGNWRCFACFAHRTAVVSDRQVVEIQRLFCPAPLTSRV